jgi:hypothetical protein
MDDIDSDTAVLNARDGMSKGEATTLLKAFMPSLYSLLFALGIMSGATMIDQFKTTGLTTCFPDILKLPAYDVYMNTHTEIICK